MTIQQLIANYKVLAVHQQVYRDVVKDLQALQSSEVDVELTAEDIYSCWATTTEEMVDFLKEKWIIWEHLSTSKVKEEVCKSCLWKKQLSEYKWVSIACADFPWDKSYVVDKWWFIISDCSRCKWTWLEPKYFG